MFPLLRIETIQREITFPQKTRSLGKHKIGDRTNEGCAERNHRFKKSQVSTSKDLKVLQMQGAAALRFPDVGHCPHDESPKVPWMHCFRNLRAVGKDNTFNTYSS